MEFVEGFPITDVEQTKRVGLNPVQISRILSTAFSRLIFIHGFVHADPHHGNIFVHPTQNLRGKRVPQVILLDHGLYKELTEKTRLGYAELWEGILAQDEAIIARGCQKLGAGEHQSLFVSMVTSKPYERVIDKTLVDEKARLRGQSNDDGFDLTTATKYLVANHREITQILNKINRDLLLLFKTNEFLRMLDNKLGSPINTYRITADFAILAISQSEEMKRHRGYFERLKLSFIRLRIRFKLFIYWLLFSLFHVNW
jgi:aarF domain-containing kinase